MAAKIPPESADSEDSDSESGDEEDRMDFMKGFTAVYGISGATQSVD